jgi:hypothetical protein|tara:strand:+ start:318 stop:497 length:180 start_codon:yes stop_codon:yes gene_type:complete
MITTIQDFLTKHKIKVAIIAGALVISTQYATCTVEPGGSDAAEEIQQEAEEAGSNSSAS